MALVCLLALPMLFIASLTSISFLISHFRFILCSVLRQTALRIVGREAIASRSSMVFLDLV